MPKPCKTCKGCEHWGLIYPCTEVRGHGIYHEACRTCKQGHSDCPIGCTIVQNQPKFKGPTIKKTKHQENNDDEYEYFMN